MGSFTQQFASEGEPQAGAVRIGGVGYDPRLIDTLLHDHADLGWLLRRVGDSMESGNFEEVSVLLTTFKTRLDVHLLTEELRFYNYLEQSLANDPVNAGMVRKYRDDMEDIARDVVAFAKKFRACDWTQETCRQFAIEYIAVGKQLARRLDCEEDALYRLYQPR